MTATLGLECYVKQRDERLERLIAVAQMIIDREEQELLKKYKWRKIEGYMKRQKDNSMHS